MAKILQSHQLDQTDKKAEPTTSSRNKLSRSRGFTLIEILLVLGIIAMITSIGIPAVGRLTYQRVAGTTRRFVGTLRSVRNDAILLNRIYRLAIDFESQTWWIEKQAKLELLGSESQGKAAADPKKPAPPPSGFSIADKYGKKPRELPGGVVFDGVLTERDGLLRSGLAYIHFFPSGYAEQSIVYLNKQGVETGGYSLYVRPANGKIEVFNRRVQSFEDTQVQ
jgi:general secretion pathway protein H